MKHLKTESETPHITPDLLDWLQRLAPLNPPSPAGTEREDLYHAGKRWVIDTVDLMYRRQEEG